MIRLALIGLLCALTACELSEEHNFESQELAAQVSDAQLRAMLLDHLERLEAHEYGWDKPKVQANFDQNCRTMAKQGVISMAERDAYLARLQKATGYGILRTPPGRPYAGTHTGQSGTAVADAYSDQRGARAEVRVTGEAEAMASAPVPGRVVWRELTVYRHGGDRWTESFRWVVRPSAGDLILETATRSGGRARARATADADMVVAFAESLDRGQAAAVAQVRPRAGVQLENSGPPRDRVELCNHMPEPASVVLGIVDRGETDSHREAVGPWTVPSNTCVKWFPKQGLKDRDVFYYARAGELETDGSHPFCTARDLARDTLVRWFGRGEPGEGSCHVDLLRRMLVPLPQGAPGFGTENRATVAAILLSPPPTERRSENAPAPESK